MLDHNFISNGSMMEEIDLVAKLTHRSRCAINASLGTLQIWVVAKSPPAMFFTIAATDG